MSSILFKSVLLVASIASLGACSHSDDSPGGISGGATGQTPQTEKVTSAKRTPPVIANDICANPFKDPAEGSVVQPAEFVRPKGNWVLVDERGYYRSQYLYPDQATMDSLSGKLIENLDETMSKVNEIDMQFEVAKVNIITPPTEARSQKFKINCTTLAAPEDTSDNEILKDTPTDHQTYSSSHKSSGNQNLNSSTPFAINASNLMAKYYAKMTYKSDGITPNLSLEFITNPSTKSLLETDFSHLPDGLKIQFIKESETSFLLRFTLEMTGTGNVSLSYGGSNRTDDQPETTYGESRDLVLPTKNIAVFQSRYKLVK